MTTLDTWLISGKPLEEKTALDVDSEPDTAQTELCWMPVALCWRVVRPGDVFLARDGQLWCVTAATLAHDSIALAATHGERHGTRKVDPDDNVPVLIPVSEYEAVNLTRAELGARVIARRTSPPPPED
jgi:hypothetical protein